MPSSNTTALHTSLAEKMLAYLNAPTGPSPEFRKSYIRKACVECFGANEARWPVEVAKALED